MRPLSFGAGATHAVRALNPARHGRPLPGGWRSRSDAVAMRHGAWSSTGHAPAPASRRSFTVATAHPSPTGRVSRLSAGWSPDFFAFSNPSLSSRSNMTIQIAGMSTPRSRGAHTVSDSRGPYEAVVVGAGPAGITALGNLLEHRIQPVLWLDESFDGGRINQMYREVPSNTKVKLFIDFAMATQPFRKIVSGLPSRSRWEEPSESDGVRLGSQEDRLRNLRQLDQEKGCTLGDAADMILMLTEGLRRTPGVVPRQGRMTGAVLDEDATGAPWTVRINTSPDPSTSTSVQTKRVILCTGAYPNDPPLPVDIPDLTHLHLDTALSPTKLSASLSPRGPTTVAVIGASHSAILVLRNLSELALSSKPDLRIKWFTRHPLRYAEYEEGFIARDNTGLKGEAATWARENLEPDTMPSSPVGRCISKLAYKSGKEAEVYAEHMTDCSFVVQAIGYRPNPVPALESSAGRPITPVFDHDSGVFHYVKEADDGSIGNLARLPGLFGAGIAFPERVVDKKYGHAELNVGFFKFMKAAKKWVEEWK